MHKEKDATTIGHRGRSLVPKVFPCRHQRVEPLLQSDDLKSHVTGGEDQNADSARRHEHSGGGGGDEQLSFSRGFLNNSKNGN